MQVRLVPPTGTAASVPPPLIDLKNGNQHSVAVTILLDDAPTGGFSIHWEPVKMFLPVVRK